MYLPNKFDKILAGMQFEIDKEGMSKAKVKYYILLDSLF